MACSDMFESTDTWIIQQALISYLNGREVDNISDMKQVPVVYLYLLKFARFEKKDKTVVSV